MRKKEQRETITTIRAKRGQRETITTIRGKRSHKNKEGAKGVIGIHYLIS